MAEARPYPTLPAHVPPRIQEVVTEAKSRLQDIYGDRLQRVVLYGSYARGEATQESDVDLLAVLGGPIENRYEEIKRTTNVQLALLDRYGLHVSIKPSTEDVYHDVRRSFIRNVHTDGIEL